MLFMMFLKIFALVKVIDEFDLKILANLVNILNHDTDESYTDVELPLKPLLFHVLISRPYDVCPRAAL